MEKCGHWTTKIYDRSPLIGLLCIETEKCHHHSPIDTSYVRHQGTLGYLTLNDGHRQYKKAML